MTTGKIAKKKTKQMPLVQGRIPADLYEWVQQRMQEAGFVSEGEYLRNVIRAERELFAPGKKQVAA
jgi:hypothetical protein